MQNSSGVGKYQYESASADLPGVHVGRWIEKCGGVQHAVGKFPSDTSVVVVGAGFTGVTLADAASRCGAKTTILEGNQEAGGRLRSKTLTMGTEGPVFTHLAAMRFGDASKLLEMHLKTENFTVDGPSFSNIGEVPSLLFDKYNGKPLYWDDHRFIVPHRFKKILHGLEKMFSDRINMYGVPLPASLESIRQRLSNPEEDSNELRNDIQAIIDFTENLNLREFYEKCFLTNTSPPGGQRWDKSDVDLSIELYRTGRHDVFSYVSAWADLKWYLNGSTTNQTYMCEEYSDGSKKLGDVHKYIIKKAEALNRRGVETYYKTKVTKIRKLESGRFQVVAEERVGEKKEVKIDADVVFVTTTLPSAVEMGLSEKGANQILEDKVCDALKNIHSTATSKIEWAVNASPWIDDPSLPKNVQFRSPFCPVYVIHETGSDIAKIHCYAWGDDALALEKIGSAQEICENVVKNAHHILDSTEYERFADAISDYRSPAVSQHWQSDDHAHGGWTFPLPGQNENASHIQYNLKSGRKIYLCGSSAGGDDAWITAGLRNLYIALNAALDKTGGIVYNDKFAPLHQMISPFNYSEK